MALMTSIMQRVRSTRRNAILPIWRKRARVALAILISAQLQLAHAQGPQRGNVAPIVPAQTQKDGQKAAGPTQIPATQNQISKLSDAEKSLERARELFADAANAQNNGAYDLAIENWQKLLKDFPNDPLASSAHHFLGVCHLQKGKPDFSAAIDQFKLALRDPQLKQREESMINLGWSLYQRHFLNMANTSQTSGNDTSSTGVAAKSIDLDEASKVLRVVVDRYPDGSFLDKALFYLAESLARLGRPDQAIEQYRNLIRNNRLSTSSIRPDAVFGLALTYEEKKQPILAIETYELFLSEYASHPFVSDVRTRMADLLLSLDRTDESIKQYEALLGKTNPSDLKNGDYVLYRYGFALAKANQFEKSAQIYKELAQRYPNSQYSKNSSLAAGQALMREKKYDEAIAAFEQLLPIKDERAAEAAHWICQIKTLQGKTAECVPIAKSALEWAGNFPSAPELKMALADGLSIDASTRQESKAIYEEIASKFPEHPIAPRATYNAAFNALQLGALNDAQRWSETFAKQFPTDPLAGDIAYIRAESTLQLGQYESAVNAFEQLIAARPDDPMASTWQGRLVVAHYLAGQWAQAIESADKLLQSDVDANTKAEILFMVGASQLKVGSVDQGIESLKQSLQASTTWTQAGDVAVSLAEALNSAKKTDEAIKVLDDLLRQSPAPRQAGQAAFRMGQYAATSKDFPKAIAAYDKTLELTQETALREYASYGKAYALIQLEKYDEALKLLEPISQTNRTDSLGIESRVAKSICLRQLKKPDEALRVLELINQNELPAESKMKILYEQSLSLIAVGGFDAAVAKLTQLSQLTRENPTVPFMFADKAVYELAWAYKSKGDHKNAVKIFEELLKNHPESYLAGEAQFHLAQAEYDSANYEKAIKAFEIAFERSSDEKLREQSLYKTGWAYFQLKDYAKATETFNKQARTFSDGALIIDGKFMVAECYLKQEKFKEAFNEYTSLRKLFEQVSTKGQQVGEQVQSLTLLHGGQSARELKNWREAESWLQELITKFPQSQFRPIALYELAYARQNNRKTAEAIAGYAEVADNFRNELGARARFMIGELYFAEKDFNKAVAEFQKVMYGYGGTQAPAEIKNWQARSAFEAGRCSEVLIGTQTGERKAKAVDTAAKFYEFVVQNHPNHELVNTAKIRIAELRK